jgi:EpsD family peptidyl-prolyl cis-trans isomerase
MIRISFNGRVLAVAAAIALAGCSGQDKPAAATQVAAKVNQEEVSVHQINNALARIGGVSPENAKEAGRQVLEKLIDQEILIQKAIEKKLDRDPRVMQAIESSRREVLSRAYLDQVAAAAARPTTEEVHDYYEKHPELFAQRRVYQFQELAAQTTDPVVLKKMQDRLPSFKSMRDIAEWLNSEKVKFVANSTTKAAEQLPLELLPRIHQMKDGQFGLVPARDGMIVMQLVASRNAPTDEATAKPFIEQYLGNKQRSAAVEKEMKALRDTAKIEYAGDFTQAALDKAKAEASAKTAEKAKAEELAKVEAKAKADERAAAEEKAIAEAKERAEKRAKLAEADPDVAKSSKVAAPAAAVVDKGIGGLR